MRDMSLKELYRINTFGYEIRSKDGKALSDAMMLHVELYRLPAPFDNQNSVPQGIGRSLSLPSLYIRRLHINLPARLRIARTRTVRFDTDDAIKQFERAVVRYPQVWRPDLKGHQLLQDMCDIIMCTYSHRQETSQDEWNTKTLISNLFLTERAWTMKTVGQTRGDLTGWEMPSPAVWP